MTANGDPEVFATDTDPSDSRPRSASDLVKFTALAALLAILADASIAHSMLWGNDPYWSYWVTDTLLMATVFGLGTAWFGGGRGGVHSSPPSTSRS